MSDRTIFVTQAGVLLSPGRVALASSNHKVNMTAGKVLFFEIHTKAVSALLAMASEKHKHELLF